MMHGQKDWVQTLLFVNDYKGEYESFDLYDDQKNKTNGMLPMIIAKPFNSSPQDLQKFDVYKDHEPTITSNGYLNLDAQKLMRYLKPVLS